MASMPSMGLSRPRYIVDQDKDVMERRVLASQDMINIWPCLAMKSILKGY